MSESEPTLLLTEIFPDMAKHLKTHNPNAIALRLRFQREHADVLKRLAAESTLEAFRGGLLMFATNYREAAEACSQ